MYGIKLLLILVVDIFVIAMAHEQSSQCNCVCGGLLAKDFRIVGGIVAEKGEFPWIVWIRLGHKNGDFCAGTLISPSYVLTAAHCLQDTEDVSDLNLYLGLHNIAEAKNPHKATSMKIHSEFVDDEELNLPNDIGIIQLDKPVEFSDRIRAACIPKENYNYDNGEATVAGWGVTAENGRPAKLLRKVKLPFVPRSLCNETFPGLRQGVVCAGYKEGKRDACQGDSGGPMHRINNAGMYELVGLVSFGEGCARPEMPAVFTKIPHYLDWIKANLGSECLCSPPKARTNIKETVNSKEEEVNSSFTPIPISLGNTVTTTQTQQRVRSNNHMPYFLIAIREMNSCSIQFLAFIMISIVNFTSSLNNTMLDEPCDCVCDNSPHKAERVVGGKNAREGEFPFVVGLYDGMYLCGGTLITRLHVLTAAHCIKNFMQVIQRFPYIGKDIHVLLGAHHVERPTMLRKVAEMTYHADYYPRTNVHDIALVKMDRPVDFNKKVRAACLPFEDDSEYLHDFAIVAGWGVLTPKGPVSKILQKAFVPLVSNEHCVQAYAMKGVYISESMLCAGRGTQDACKGDSGGPLIGLNMRTKTEEVIGIVSFGRGCGKPEFPGVYTKVTSYLGWILQQIGEECLCFPFVKK
ncbi:transmembrane protease serine 9-like [Periplaneta americana]|uniref:transmembrane protease serine 9-like n=1 Tax=Periplaneta americana TaxID=6978 RepID=UPI0037E7E81D